MSNVRTEILFNVYEYDEDTRERTEVGVFPDHDEAIGYIGRMHAAGEDKMYYLEREAIQHHYRPVSLHAADGTSVKWGE